MSMEEINMIYKEAENQKKEKGFTIVEFLIVVAVIGVLAAISVPVFTAQLEKKQGGGRYSECQSSICRVDGEGA